MCVRGVTPRNTFAGYLFLVDVPQTPSSRNYFHRVNFNLVGCRYFFYNFLLSIYRHQLKLSSNRMETSGLASIVHPDVVKYFHDAYLETNTTCPLPELIDLNSSQTDSVSPSKSSKSKGQKPPVKKRASSTSSRPPKKRKDSDDLRAEDESDGSAPEKLKGGRSATQNGGGSTAVKEDLTGDDSDGAAPPAVADDAAGSLESSTPTIRQKKIGPWRKKQETASSADSAAPLANADVIKSESKRSLSKSSDAAGM